METKKNPRVNLEKKRIIFLQTGFIVSLSLVLLAFQWTDKNDNENIVCDLQPMELPDELPPITKPKETIKVPPLKIIPVIQIVPDTKEPSSPVDLNNIEPDDNTAIIPIEPTPEPEIDEVFDYYGMENKAEFPGGENGMMNWVRKETVYPKEAIQLGISGKVFVSFIIDKSGNVTNVEIARPVDPLLDKEALRVVNGMPKWKPARQNTKPVKVTLTIPINFILE